MNVSEEQMEEMLKHSYRNFHVKGFDYLCLLRSDHHTRKVYFFDGEVSKLPEVVNPHDHRYNFRTTVLAGAMSNSIYVPDEEFGDVYNEFEWRTPLNGGNGFTFKKETRLTEDERFFYRKGERHHMKAEEFHTIRLHKEGTVLILDQAMDIVPLDQPTRTFIKDGNAPNLDGLYERFNPDQLLERLRQYDELMGGG